MLSVLRKENGEIHQERQISPLAYATIYETGNQADFNWASANS